MADNANVVVTWVSGHRFLARSGSGHAWAMDNPSHADGAAASPMEMVLAAVAGCAGIDVVSILEKMRQPLAQLQIAVEGQRRAEQPRIFTHVTVVFRAFGEGVEPNKLLRAVGLSESTYCSVTAMLRPAVTLSFRVELNGQPCLPAPS